MSCIASAKNYHRLTNDKVISKDNVRPGLSQSVLHKRRLCEAWGQYSGHGAHPATSATVILMQNCYFTHFIAPNKKQTNKKLSRWGFAPDPTGGTYNASPHPLVGWGGARRWHLLYSTLWTSPLKSAPMSVPVSVNMYCRYIVLDQVINTVYYFILRLDMQKISTIILSFCYKNLASTDHMQHS